MTRVEIMKERRSNWLTFRKLFNEVMCSPATDGIEQALQKAPDKWKRLKELAHRDVELKSLLRP